MGGVDFGDAERIEETTFGFTFFFLTDHGVLVGKVLGLLELFEDGLEIFDETALLITGTGIDCELLGLSFVGQLKGVFKVFSVSQVDDLQILQHQRLNEAVVLVSLLLFDAIPCLSETQKRERKKRMGKANLDFLGDDELIAEEKDTALELLLVLVDDSVLFADELSVFAHEFLLPHTNVHLSVSLLVCFCFFPFF